MKIRFLRPNFGRNLVIDLWIDGREVANIERDRRYDRFMSAGHHVLTVLAVPDSEFRQPRSIDLTVQPGRTYVFTAAWESDHVVLYRSTLHKPVSMLKQRGSSIAVFRKMFA